MQQPPFVAKDDNIADALDQVIQEIQETPEEHLPSLLKIIRLFRESVMLDSAEASFRQGWKEAMMGDTIPVSQLWDSIDAA